MRMSELVKGDEALSDDYEEGEILEDEAMSVSSSEEVETDGGRIHRRRKEHKCKDTSLCRKERPGKKCIGRISMRTVQGPEVLHSKNEIGTKNQSAKSSSHYQRTVYISAKPVYYKISQKTNEENDSRKTERTVTEKSHNEKENKIIRKKYPDRPHPKKWGRRRPRREQTGTKDEHESEELMELRMEALKSAVISKHVARKKKGKKVKRSSCSLEDLEGSLNEYVLGRPEPDAPKQDEKSVSFSGPLKFSLQPKTNRNCLKNNVLEKFEKRKSKWDTPQDPGAPPEDEDEVSKLRELALMSVKSKPEESKKATTFNNSPTPGPNRDELRVVEMDIDEESQEPVVESEDLFNDDGSPNVDLDGLPISMAKGEPPESIKNSEESWDDELDEEILRAQCLSSLASKIPTAETSPEKPSKPLLKIPQNPRIIINLNDTDSTSEDEEDDPPLMAIENSVDKLLEEARQKVEMEEKESTPASAPTPPPAVLPTPAPVPQRPPKPKPPMPIAKPLRKKMDLRKVTITKNASKTTQTNSVKRTPTLPGTPLAVKHLPAQRQEEYRQLKLRLALLKKKAAQALPQDTGTSSVAPLSIQTNSLAQPKEDNTVTKDKMEQDTTTKQKKNEEELLAQSEISLKKAANLVNIRWTAMNDVVDGMEKIKSDYLALESEMYRKMQEVFAIKEEMAKKANLIHRRTCILSDNSSSMEMDLTTYTQMKKRCQNLGSKLRGSSYKLPSEEPLATVEKSIELLRRGESLCSDIKSSSSINLGGGPPAKKIKTNDLRIVPASEPAKTGTAPRTPVPTSSVSDSTSLSCSSLPNSPVESPDPSKAGDQETENNEIAQESQSSGGKLYRTSSNWDPHTLICPFDLCGECRDETCTYQHFEASSNS